MKRVKEKKEKKICETDEGRVERKFMFVKRSERGGERWWGGRGERWWGGER